jgi:hypothetical protein
MDLLKKLSNPATAKKKKLSNPATAKKQKLRDTG